MMINLMLAIGLAMDSFAVALAKGLNIRQNKITKAITIALFFGVFQGGIAYSGWLFGKAGISNLIKDYDHWVAFLLLSFIGGKMLYTAFFAPAEKEHREDKLTLQFLVLMAIATSIDAAAVGLSIAILNQPILALTLTITAVTLTLSFIGVLLGQKLGKLLQQKVEIIGGIILIGIGIKVVIEHLSGN